MLEKSIQNQQEVHIKKMVFNFDENKDEKLSQNNTNKNNNDLSARANLSIYTVNSNSARSSKSKNITHLSTLSFLQSLNSKQSRTEDSLDETKMAVATVIETYELPQPQNENKADSKKTTNRIPSKSLLFANIKHREFEVDLEKLKRKNDLKLPKKNLPKTAGSNMTINSYLDAFKSKFSF